MALEDPEIQKGLLVTLAGMFAAVLWWVKRRIGLVDALSSRVSTLETNHVSRAELVECVGEIKADLKLYTGHIDSKIGDVHKRVDQIYLNMPKREGE